MEPKTSDFNLMNNINVMTSYFDQQRPLADQDLANQFIKNINLTDQCDIQQQKLQHIQKGSQQQSAKKEESQHDSWVERGSMPRSQSNNNFKMISNPQFHLQKYYSDVFGQENINPEGIGRGSEQEKNCRFTIDQKQHTESCSILHSQQQLQRAELQEIGGELSNRCGQTSQGKSQQCSNNFAFSNSHCSNENNQGNNIYTISVQQQQCNELQQRCSKLEEEVRDLRNIKYEKEFYEKAYKDTLTELERAHQQAEINSTTGIQALKYRIDQLLIEIERVNDVVAMQTKEIELKKQKIREYESAGVIQTQQTCQSCSQHNFSRESVMQHQQQQQQQNQLQQQIKSQIEQIAQLTDQLQQSRQQMQQQQVILNDNHKVLQSQNQTQMIKDSQFEELKKQLEQLSQGWARASEENAQLAKQLREAEDKSAYTTNDQVLLKVQTLEGKVKELRDDNEFLSLMYKKKVEESEQIKSKLKAETNSEKNLETGQLRAIIEQLKAIIEQLKTDKNTETGQLREENEQLNEDQQQLQIVIEQLKTEIVEQQGRMEKLLTQQKAGLEQKIEQAVTTAQVQWLYKQEEEKKQQQIQQQQQQELLLSYQIEVASLQQMLSMAAQQEQALQQNYQKEKQQDDIVVQQELQECRKGLARWQQDYECQLSLNVASEQKILMLQMKLGECEERAAQMSKNMSELMENEQRSSQEKAELQVRLVAMAKENNVLTEKVDVRESDIKALQEQIKSINCQCNVLQSELDENTLQGQRKQLQLIADLEDSQHKMQQAREQVQQLQEQVVCQERQLKEREETLLEKMNQMQSKLSDNLKIQDDQQEEIRQMISSLKEEKERHERFEDELREKIQQAEETEQQLRKELAQNQSELETKNEELECWQMKVAKLQTIVEQKEGEELDSVRIQKSVEEQEQKRKETLEASEMLVVQQAAALEALQKQLQEYQQCKSTQQIQTQAQTQTQMSSEVAVISLQKMMTELEKSMRDKVLQNAQLQQEKLALSLQVNKLEQEVQMQEEQAAKEMEEVKIQVQTIIKGSMQDQIRSLQLLHQTEVQELEQRVQELLHCKQNIEATLKLKVMGLAGEEKQLQMSKNTIAELKSQLAAARLQTEAKERERSLLEQQLADVRKQMSQNEAAIQEKEQLYRDEMLANKVSLENYFKVCIEQHLQELITEHEEILQQKQQDFQQQLQLKQNQLEECQLKLTLLEKGKAADLNNFKNQIEQIKQSAHSSHVKEMLCHSEGKPKLSQVQLRPALQPNNKAARVIVYSNSNERLENKSYVCSAFN